MKLFSKFYIQEFSLFYLKNSKKILFPIFVPLTLAILHLSHPWHRPHNFMAPAMLQVAPATPFSGSRHLSLLSESGSSHLHSLLVLRPPCLSKRPPPASKPSATLHQATVTTKILVVSFVISADSFIFSLRFNVTD
ncbi:unnamed protein product [Vicia faba]|uniref:Uncharacterized protein n=1 Tax=Vicia faba TaxID=3906 RepID=A0AAV1AQ97_VICFA|nr:unnamed protein product [Vicia faba]